MSPSKRLGARAHLWWSSCDSDGMLWQLRMGERKGGEGSVLLRLRPELFLPLLRLPSDPARSVVEGVCACTVPSQRQPPSHISVPGQLHAGHPEAGCSCQPLVSHPALCCSQMPDCSRHAGPGCIL